MLNTLLARKMRLQETFDTKSLNNSELNYCPPCMQQIEDVVQDHRSFLGSIQKEEFQYDPFLTLPIWHRKI
jgi:hypothetical protein